MFYCVIMQGIWCLKFLFLKDNKIWPDTLH